MTIAETIKAIMKESKTTQVKLAEMAGLSGSSSVAMALTRDMTTSTVVKFCEAMGYEVVIQKKKPGRRAEGQYVVDGVVKEK